MNSHLDISQINKERIRDTFAALSGIDSLSFKEREMADKLTRRLEGLGFDLYEDDAYKHYLAEGQTEPGEHAGNLYGYLRGGLPGESLLLSAHMDTVSPGVGKKAIFHDNGEITSDGSTVLGADDLCGVVAILEAVAALKEAGIPHRDVEVLLPFAEEVYVKGSKHFDYSRIKSRDGYVLDMSGPTGTAAIQAPSIIQFKVTVRGKSAHAGFEPEKGVSALALMCSAISQIRQGRIDQETTANIGIIQGGSATNIVVGECICHGEVRSSKHEKALAQIEGIRSAFQGMDFTMELDIVAEAYEINPATRVVQRFQKACHELGLEGNLRTTFGGSDNNVYVKHGIDGIVISCGMFDVHTVKEHTSLDHIAEAACLVARLLTISQE